MQYIFFDEQTADFFPLTYTRPIADLRMGALTNAERWRWYLCAHSEQMGYAADLAYLRALYPAPALGGGDYCFINGRAIGNATWAQELQALQPKQSLMYNGKIIGFRIEADDKTNLYGWKTLEGLCEWKVSKIADNQAIILQRAWDLFRFNAQILAADFDLLTRGRSSAAISRSNTIIGDESRVFLEAGAQVEAATLNVRDAPIYIGKNAEIMEGALIRGGLALGEGAQIKMGAKLYGANTVGDHCKIGGELGNSVFWGYSNKGHEGYVGNSVVGQWCNFGADTNTSNLKNNYSTVDMWNYSRERMESTGLTFCGLVMGDHSKCGINTMFNTGTTVGVSVNFFGAGYPPKHIPSFTWGGSEPAQWQTYALPKALDTAARVLSRRNLPLDDAQKNMLTAIWKETKEQRL